MALSLTNTLIADMEAVLANPNVPGNRAMIDATFGVDPSLHFPSIVDTVAKLKTGTFPIMLPLAKINPALAFTFYDATMSPKYTQFGRTFYAQRKKKTCKYSQRAQEATLIHEATHYLADTGDYIHRGEFLKGSDETQTSRTGYTGRLDPYETIAGLDGDIAWIKMRDGYEPKIDPKVPPVKKMHINAESYAQLVSIAGHAAGHLMPNISDIAFVVQDKY
ncbi:hypothetical protein D9613_009735 [Agrocybe pediades]|uniref:Lysine-specific metallo-endopeptidase domain-containing protein n=1 Tax=Agrocybe pediades TaxID=84607 RepID=A0A8H4QWJ3_9AGAR|nr:hypothetical protein D9613_009735 [Agrocybe pediades]